MNEIVNPDNVNPHFEHPERFGLYPVNPPVQPCPSCGHCPTCGRGPGYTYFGPVWRYDPFQSIPCTTSGGEGTVRFGAIS
jgi:hypothetical protein